MTQKTLYAESKLQASVQQ